MAKKNRAAGIGVGVLFAAAGVTVLIFGMAQINKAKASAHWPSVAGVIKFSEIRSETRTRTDSTSSRQDRNGNGGVTINIGTDSDRNTRTETTHYADIGYAYAVDGAAFNETRVNFGSNGSGSWAKVQDVVDRYPVGKTVDVFYNPAKPSESVLEPGMTGGAYFLPVFGGVFALIGVGAIVATAIAMKKGVGAEPCGCGCGSAEAPSES
jgi:hypothetical protein